MSVWANICIRAYATHHRDLEAFMSDVLDSLTSKYGQDFGAQFQRRLWRSLTPLVQTGPDETWALIGKELVTDFNAKALCEVEQVFTEVQARNLGCISLIRTSIPEDDWTGSIGDWLLNDQSEDKFCLIGDRFKATDSDERVIATIKAASLAAQPESVLHRAVDCFLKLNDLGCGDLSVKSNRDGKGKLVSATITMNGESFLLSVMEPIQVGPTCN